MAQNVLTNQAISDIKLAAMKRQAQVLGGRPGATTRFASTDTAAALPDAAIKDAAGNVASAILVTFETQSVRVAIGATPTAGTSGLGHSYAAGAREVFYGPDVIAAIKIISAAAGQAGALQITAFF